MKIYQLILVLALLFTVSCKDKSEQEALINSEVARFLKNADNTVFSDSLRTKYLNFAHAELADGENDSLKRSNLMEVAGGYYNLGIYDRSLDVSRETFKLGNEAKDTLVMAKALYYIADSFYGQSENDSAFVYYTQAEKLYEKVNELESLGEIVLYKAYLYYNAGEYLLSETEGVKALRLLVDSENRINVYNCYNLIGTSLDGQDSNEEAIKYFEQALKELGKFKEQGFSDSDIAEYRASCYNNMGLVYVKMKQYDKAISLYNDALSYESLKEEKPSLYAKLLNNLAYAEFKKKDYSNLPELFFKALRIRDSIHNKSGIVTSNIQLGEYYADQQDTIKAITHLKVGYYQAKAIRSHFDILNSLKLLSEIDNQKKQFYDDKYIRVTDSLQKVSKTNKDKFARIEYETDKLQWENQELVKRNSLIIGVSAITLLFLGALFMIYFLNSRNKKLLLIQEQQNANEEIYHLMYEQQSKIDKAREEEKGRIAMELHDGILNNIYAVRLNLEFINKKADEESIAKRKEYIKQLQVVETEIRGVSHDLSRNAVFADKSFRDLLEQIILSQKNNFNTSFDADIDYNINWEDMPNIKKVNIYRIIQEGLQNVNKYSGAKEATVTIIEEGNNLRLIIKDNGIGFDPERAKGGIGIKNLKKRAAALNGSINIISAPGKGTEIVVIFPNY